MKTLNNTLKTPICSRYLVTSFALASLVACSLSDEGPNSMVIAEAEQVQVQVQEQRQIAASLPQPYLDKEKQEKKYSRKDLAMRSKPSNIAGKAMVSVAHGFMKEEDVSVYSPVYSGRYFNDSIAVEPVPGAGENYNSYADSGFLSVFKEPLSTFSVDVDTASYANMRRFINQGQIPPQDSIRTEELINYFSYDYEIPANKSKPFNVEYELAPSPWDENRNLLHVGLKGFEVEAKDMVASNLVFLLDVSGSMNSPNKLGLVKKSLKMLVKQMRSEDRVSLVVYAGAAGVVLNPTSGDNQRDIINALNRLQAGGSTNGAQGIELAYQIATDNFIDGGINRVILATDGDFNVGLSSVDELKKFIDKKRQTGVTLSILGFGQGNYNDHLMEELSNLGNGNASYIDSLKEAQKVLVNEMSSTLFTIAKDVKIQVEFNPALVKEYRLLGYENRALKNEDFNNDKIDAGDIGAGHTVTAIYELVFTGSNSGFVDPLRYQATTKVTATDTKNRNEIAFIKLRYKLPEEKNSKLMKVVVQGDSLKSSIGETSDNFQFSAAVAGFGQLLRESSNLNDFAYADVIKMAQSSRGRDSFGYRSEFIQLVRMAESLN